MILKKRVFLEKKMILEKRAKILMHLLFDIHGEITLLRILSELIEQYKD